MTEVHVHEQLPFPAHCAAQHLFRLSYHSLILQTTPEACKTNRSLGKMESCHKFYYVTTQCAMYVGASDGQWH